MTNDDILVEKYKLKNIDETIDIDDLIVVLKEIKKKYGANILLINNIDSEWSLETNVINIIKNIKCFKPGTIEYLALLDYDSEV